MKRFLFLAVALTIILGACSQSGDKSDLGTEVTFVTRGEGDKLISGQIITMTMWYGIDGETIRESNGNTLPYQYYEDTLNINGEFASVLELLSVGDSVRFTVPAKDLFEKTFRQPLPDTIAADKGIEWALSVEEQFTLEEYEVVARQKASEAANKLLAEETAAFEAYFASENINTVKTESGLQYVITERGNGPIPEVGQRITAKYKGMYFNNMENVFDQGEYTFPLGQRNVIPGWDEGFTYFPVGSKGVLYIPSELAYGPSGRRPIGPNEPLVFEVELLEIVE
ncbi:MAG: FKBP-type peptidyl-prolyl cis-trans isomerase [Cytophagales bacterium]|nr:FKBP-type peptidyl-prolyl cis-trans isomerase [Cytophagales bacterium]